MRDGTENVEIIVFFVDFLKKNLKASKIRNLKDTQAVFWPSVMMLWRGNFQKKQSAISILFNFFYCVPAIVFFGKK